MGGPAFMCLELRGLGDISVKWDHEKDRAYAIREHRITQNWVEGRSWRELIQYITKGGMLFSQQKWSYALTYFFFSSHMWWFFGDSFSLMTHPGKVKDGVSAKRSGEEQKHVCLAPSPPYSEASAMLVPGSPGGGCRVTGGFGSTLVVVEAPDLCDSQKLTF